MRGEYSLIYIKYNLVCVYLIDSYHRNTDITFKIELLGTLNDICIKVNTSLYIDKGSMKLQQMS